jgi:hypothetical protein
VTLYASADEARHARQVAPRRLRASLKGRRFPTCRHYKGITLELAHRRGMSPRSIISKRHMRGRVNAHAPGMAPAFAPFGEPLGRDPAARRPPPVFHQATSARPRVVRTTHRGYEVGGAIRLVCVHTMSTMRRPAEHKRAHARLWDYFQSVVPLEAESRKPVVALVVELCRAVWR